MPHAMAGQKTIKRLIADHLADDHGCWLTTVDYRGMTVSEVAALDPCLYVLVA